MIYGNSPQLVEEKLASGWGAFVGCNTTVTLPLLTIIPPPPPLAATQHSCSPPGSVIGSQRKRFVVPLVSERVVPAEYLGLCLLSPFFGVGLFFAGSAWYQIREIDEGSVTSAVGLPIGSWAACFFCFYGELRGLPGKAGVAKEPRRPKHTRFSLEAK